MTLRLRARFTPWRTALAVLLYGFAGACLLIGLLLRWSIPGAFARRASTGDFAGPSMLLWSLIAWLAPLVMSATLLALLLRWPAQSHAEGERLAPDRRWMRGLERAGRGARAIALASLVGTSLATFSGFAFFSYRSWASASRFDGAGPGAASPAALAPQLLQLFGPLLLLAVSCALVAWRIARGERASARP